MKIELLLNLIVTLVTSVLTFVVNKYFANYMGIRDLGLMKLFTQMIAYLSIVELGLGTASAYALYKPLMDRDLPKINIIFSTISSLYSKISIIILIVGIVINPVIPFFIKDINLNQNVYIYWSLYVINTSLGYIFVKYNILYIANQKFKYTRLVQGFSKIFTQIIQILILLKFQSFLLFILALILENIIQFLLYKIYYKKNYSYITLVKEREKNIYKDLMNLFWHKLSGLIVFNTDYILISKFISLNMVGIYSSYLMIVNMIITLISIATNVITPKIGKLVASNSQEKIYLIWKNLNIFFVLVGLILTYTTYKTIDSFIELWLGKEFVLSRMTVVLIMINLFIQSTRIIIEIFKNAYGFFSDIYLPLIESLVNLILSLILVKCIGIDGVIIGTLVSNILIIVLAKPILVFEKCFNKTYDKYIKILIQYLLLVFIVFLINELIFSKFIILGNAIDWYEWFTTVIKVAMICTFVSLIVFSFNREFRKSLRRK